MTALRLIWAGWRFHVKALTLSGFFLLTSAIQPVIFATIAFFMFRAGAREGTLLYVSLGAGLMGIWSSTLFGSGGAIQWQRWQGTLEVLIAAPASFLLVLAADGPRLGHDRALLADRDAASGAGSSSACRSSSSSRCCFLVAIPATVIGLGLLGLVMASTFILWRNANALSNLLEYPIWLVTGLLVPISLLPGWVAPIAWVLAPTWGVRAIRDAALGRRRAGPADRDVPRPGRGLPADRLDHRPPLREARPRPGDAVADMNNVRVFFIGGYIAYRALFNWIHRSIYVPTMLGSPIFQILFFAYVGRFAGLEDDAFFVVGNAVQVACMAGIYGMALTIGGERWTQTLSPLLATPANRFALFMGRALPNFVNGLIVSAFGFLVGWALLDFDPRARRCRRSHSSCVVSTASCTGLGLVIGSIGLRARDVLFLANLVYFMLLFVLRRQHPARRAARLDAGDRQRAAADARDRGSARGDGRRAAVRGRRPALDGGGDRHGVRAGRLRPVPLLRGGRPPPCHARDDLSAPTGC